VAMARAWARVTLNEWGFAPPLIENVTICVSEMVTNAIQASAVLRLPAQVHVALAHQGRWLLLAVADASPAFPVRLAADGDAIGGRGLAMVEALSTSWGWHPVRWHGLIKVVWSEWSRN
jgi:anti-sigma regulatory factor (Ser/Thr protein kinase)